MDWVNSNLKSSQAKLSRVLANVNSLVRCWIASPCPPESTRAPGHTASPPTPSAGANSQVTGGEIKHACPKTPPVELPLLTAHSPSAAGHDPPPNPAKPSGTRGPLALLSATISLPNAGSGSALWAAKPRRPVQRSLLSLHPSCSDKGPGLTQGNFCQY